MPSPPRERLIEQALTLIVLEASAASGFAGAGAGTDTDTVSGLRQWRLRSAEHEAAAGEAQQRWDALGGMAGDIRGRFHATAPEAGKTDAAQAQERQRQPRRKLLLGIAAVVGTGALGGGQAWRYWRQPLFAATFDTGIGETRRIALADGSDAHPGSRIDMAPHSAIEVALYRRRREIRMRNGEIRCDVASDRARPFVVFTRAARIEVIGTAFTVRDRGGAVTVGVERGHVQVRGQTSEQWNFRATAGDTAGDVVADLYPGQILTIRDGVPQPVRNANATALSAWRDGWLVFDNAALEDALASVNAYRRHPIATGDPRVAAMRFSGRFRTEDSNGLLAVLPTILPLYVLTRADGSVLLQAR